MLLANVKHQVIVVIGLYKDWCIWCEYDRQNINNNYIYFVTNDWNGDGCKTMGTNI